MFCVYAKHHILTANNTHTHGHKSFSLIDPSLNLGSIGVRLKAGRMKPVSR